MLWRLVRASCTDKSDSELNFQVPGWPALQQHVRSIWGTGDWEVEVNVPGVRASMGERSVYIQLLLTLRRSTRTNLQLSAWRIRFL